MAQVSSKHRRFHLTLVPCNPDVVGPHTQASTVLLHKVVSFAFRLPFCFRQMFAAFSGVLCRSATCMIRHLSFWPSGFLVGIISIHICAAFS